MQSIFKKLFSNIKKAVFPCHSEERQRRENLFAGGSINPQKRLLRHSVFTPFLAMTRESICHFERIRQLPATVRISLHEHVKRFYRFSPFHSLLNSRTSRITGVIFIFLFLFLGIAFSQPAYGATPVYYSVGQTTDNLMTGTPTVTIASGTATFSTAQTGNIGVGDRITFGAASTTVYISGKIDTSNWDVVTATGTIPTNVTSETVGSITREYTSLSAAEAGAGDSSHIGTTSLVSADIQLNLALYYDTGPDTVAVTIDGWETSSTTYIKIYTPNNTATEANQNQRHDGVWDDGKWRMELSGSALNVYDWYVNLDGIQIKNSGSGWGGQRVIFTRSGTRMNIKNSIIVTDYIYSGTAMSAAIEIEYDNLGYFDTDEGSYLFAYNNIIYSTLGTINPETTAIRDRSFSTSITATNNTISNVNFGIVKVNNLGPSYKKNLYLNNIVQGEAFDTTTLISGLYGVAYGEVSGGEGYISTSSDYNISSDTTAPGINSITNATVMFRNEAGNDFRLHSDDTNARDAGTSTPVIASVSEAIYDIQGTARGGAWDIGADEIPVDFVSIICENTSAGGECAGLDYSTLSAWESGTEVDLTPDTTRVFGGIATGTISRGDTLTLFSEGATTTVTGVVAATNNLGGATVYREGFEDNFLPDSFGTWTTGGTASFTQSSTDLYEGTYSARSGVISHSQESWIELEYTCLGECELEFYWRVSSEANWDFLNYCQDISDTCSRTTRTLNISGETGWAKVTRTGLSSGTHKFRWGYYKDSNTTHGSDAGWIDSIKITDKSRQILLHSITNSDTPVILQNGDRWIDTTGNNYFEINGVGDQLGASARAVAKIDGAWSAADTSSVTISGWETDNDNSIKIYTTDLARHKGKWNSSVYRLRPPSNSNALTFSENNIEIEGLVFDGSDWNSNSTKATVYNSATGYNDVIISENVFHNIYNYGVSSAYGYYGGEPGTGSVKIYNNIIYNSYSLNDGSYGIKPNYSPEGKKYYIYNNTIHGLYVGIYGSSSSANKFADIINNIVQYCDTDYSVSSNFDITQNNISSDSSSPNTEFRNITVDFISTSTQDFHLASTDTGAQDKGLDLSNDPYINFSDDIDGQSRTSAEALWSIGADEPPTQIYRSVAPSRTTSIATGASRSVSISSSTAIFSTALPNDVGVGDVIQYDSNNDGAIDALAFIHARASSTEYSVREADGGFIASTTTVADNDWAIFRAYTSLSSAEAGIENTGINSALRNFDDWALGGDATDNDLGRDLVTNNEVWNIALYADGTTEDTISVTIQSWDADEYNYLRIYTPFNESEVGVSQRHNGVWDDNKYRLKTTNATGIAIREAYIKIEGLQIGITNDSGGSSAIYSYGGDYAQTYSNILRNFSEKIYNTGLRHSFSDHTYSYNNIIYGFSIGISLSGHGNYNNARYENNTVYGCSQGIYIGPPNTYATVYSISNNIFYKNDLDVNIEDGVSGYMRGGRKSL